MTLNDVVTPIEIVTYSAEEGTVNGHTVTRGGYATIHDACIALTVPYAQQVGGPILTHAVDTIGPPAEYWLHVHPDGHATPVPRHIGPASAPLQAVGPASGPLRVGGDQVPQVSASTDGTHDDRAVAQGAPVVAEPFRSDPALLEEAWPLAPEPVTALEPVPSPRPDIFRAPSPEQNGVGPALTRSARRHAAGGWSSADPTVMPPSALPTGGPIGSPLAPARSAPPVVPIVPVTPLVIPTLDDLLAARPPLPTGPAQLGWRATVRQLTGGLISLRPSQAEVGRRQAIAAVQRSLTGPKTVVVINPKGGANKTTATLLIAATFGIHRGGYTLAWDNNETRGTMGWRARQGRHTNTAVDLLRELDRFGDARSARVGDLDNFVRSQGNAQFDVLASDEDATSAASIDAEAFNALHHSLSRFYRIIVVDTGNNMRASNWDAALDAADQVVIVSTIREDTAQSAAWVADALNEKGHRDKVAGAVTVLASPGVKPDPALTSRLRDHFGRLTRAVVQVPFDPALVAGGPIDVEALSSASRDAWLQATAHVADGL